MNKRTAAYNATSDNRIALIRQDATSVPISATPAKSHVSTRIGKST
jgi:type IV secretory pathway TraG/TraD family ATPase VirD4